jgi:hypothetical protein
MKPLPLSFIPGQLISELAFGEAVAEVSTPTFKFATIFPDCERRLTDNSPSSVWTSLTTCAKNPKTEVPAALVIAILTAAPSPKSIHG